MPASLLCAEAIAPVANMLAAAWAAGAAGAGQDAALRGAALEARQEPIGAPASGSAQAGSREAGSDEGREQGHRSAPRPGGGDLRAAVDAGAGARSRRVDRAAVRAGR